MWRMLREMGPEKLYIIVGLTALAFASVCNLATPQLMGKFIDKLSQTPPEVGEANKIVVLMVIIMSMLAVFNLLNMSFLWIAGDRVVRRLRKQLFKCIVYREVAFFDSTRTGELLSRLSGDVTAVNTALTTEIAEVTQRIVLVLGGFAYMLYLSW
jgi:ABC-type multidrug transport system fused ATPase/permease subunit